MKYCPNCGRELADDMKFCGGCGTPQMIGEQVAETTKKKKSKGRGLLIILVVVLLVGTVAAGVCLFTGKLKKDDVSATEEDISASEAEEEAGWETEENEEVDKKNTEIVWMPVEENYCHVNEGVFWALDHQGNLSANGNVIYKNEYDQECRRKKRVLYDSDNNLVGTVEYTWQKNEKKCEYVVYNANNEIVEKQESIYYDLLDYSEKSYKVWDEEENLIYSQEWDEHGNILSEIEYGSSTIEYQYVYNENGKLYSKYIFQEGNLEKKYEYFYDEYGNQIRTEELWIREDGTDFVVETLEFDYDENGNIIEERTYSDEAEEGEVIEYLYDLNGNVTEERHYETTYYQKPYEGYDGERYEDGNRSNQIETTRKNTYDEYGNMLTSVTEGYEGEIYESYEYVWQAFEREITD